MHNIARAGTSLLVIKIKTCPQRWRFLFALKRIQRKNPPQKYPRNARVTSSEELGTISKNNLYRGITLGVRPISTTTISTTTTTTTTTTTFLQPLKQSTHEGLPFHRNRILNNSIQKYYICIKGFTFPIERQGLCGYRLLTLNPPILYSGTSFHCLRMTPFSQVRQFFVSIVSLFHSVSLHIKDRLSFFSHFCPTVHRPSALQKVFFKSNKYHL